MVVRWVRRGFRNFLASKASVSFWSRRAWRQWAAIHSVWSLSSKWRASQTERISLNSQFTCGTVSYAGLDWKSSNSSCHSARR